MTATRTTPYLHYPRCVPEDNFISRGVKNDPRRRWITTDGNEHKNITEARQWVAASILKKNKPSVGDYGHAVQYHPGTWANQKVSHPKKEKSPMKQKTSIPTQKPSQVQFFFSYTDPHGNVSTYSTESREFMRKFLERHFPKN